MHRLCQMWSYSSCILMYMYESYWLYPLVLFAPMCESPLRTVFTWAYYFTLLVFSLVWESVANCIHMGLLFHSLVFSLVWESVADCIHMGLLICCLVWESVANCIHIGLVFYSFGLLPCVRVHWGLYPHGLTDLLFWFAPLCDSPMQTASTWACCFTLLACSLVSESFANCIHMGLLICCLEWESVADCIHMGLLFYSFGLLPCVRVCYRLYSHGFTVLLFWFAPLCESPLWTVSTWSYCFTLLAYSLVWLSNADCIHMGLLICCLVWESVADCIHMGLLFYSFGFLLCAAWSTCGVWYFIPMYKSWLWMVSTCGVCMFSPCVSLLQDVHVFSYISWQSLLKDKIEGTITSNIGMTLLSISLVLLFTLPFFTPCRYS